MRPQRYATVTEQVVVTLREGMAGGRWRGTLPGRERLAGELGVNHKTVEAAVRCLVTEGWLVSQGATRRRRIVVPKGGKRVKALRIAILNYDPPQAVERFLIELEHSLLDAGHEAFFSAKSLTEMRMDTRRVAAHVRDTEADAWVVSGGSREVLEWFVKRGIPAIALFGRRRGVPLAGVGPDKTAEYRSLTKRLLELGHRRISLLARAERRLPTPGTVEQAFLDELGAHGIPSGPYHLPDWEETGDGLVSRLEELFRATPPTALIVDEPPFFFATMQFLMNRGLRVPHDVSVVCMDSDPYFTWLRPSVSHIAWDRRLVVRRIVRWAGNVARGKEDTTQTMTKAVFIEGGTVGPV